MTYYIDLSEANEAVGFIAGEGEEIILTGTEIHREPEKYRPLGEVYAKEKDLHFWFGEEGPEEVYTIPRTELVCYDSRGGWVASLHDRWIYIDREKNCFRLPEAEQITALPNDWYDRREAIEPIHFFTSREEAEKKFPIRDVAAFLKM